MTSTALATSLPPIGLGTVAAVADDHVGVRADGLGALRAEVAALPWPRPGDRVVLASTPEGRVFVIGVLRSAADEGAPTRALEPRGDGARWVLPEGDLEIAAERGRVVLRARDGVTVETEADVELEAGGAVRLSSDEGRSALRLEGDAARLEAGLLEARAARLRVVAESLEAVAARADAHIERARQRFEVVETEAERIVQTARTMLSTVEDVAETRAGRMRMVAEGAFHALAGRARLVAREVFHIDGDRIHLG